MNTKMNTIQLYTLSLREAKSVLIALAFIVGNIILPQLCHLVPQGGLILLPIYFFTLVGAYKYGWQVGLFTAIASPIINSMLFGMPAPAAMPVILIKSVLLALSAGLMAKHTHKVTLWSLIAVVLSYQIFGGMAEWAIKGTIQAPLQDFKLGLPGLILQVVGGYMVIRYLLKK